MGGKPLQLQQICAFRLHKRETPSLSWASVFLMGQQKYHLLVLTTGSTRRHQTVEQATKPFCHAAGHVFHVKSHETICVRRRYKRSCPPPAPTHTHKIIYNVNNNLLFPKYFFPSRSNFSFILIIYICNNLTAERGGIVNQ